MRLRAFPSLILENRGRARARLSASFHSTLKIENENDTIGNPPPIRAGNVLLFVDGIRRR
jgi:hypothetical protein